MVSFYYYSPYSPNSPKSNKLLIPSQKIIKMFNFFSLLTLSPSNLISIHLSHFLNTINVLFNRHYQNHHKPTANKNGLPTFHSPKITYKQATIISLPSFCVNYLLKTLIYAFKVWLLISAIYFLLNLDWWDQNSDDFSKMSIFYKIFYMNCQRLFGYANWLSMLRRLIVFCEHLEK